MRKRSSPWATIIFAAGAFESVPVTKYQVEAAKYRAEAAQLRAELAQIENEPQPAATPTP
jgi:hypothetical protein